MNNRQGIAKKRFMELQISKKCGWTFLSFVFSMSVYAQQSPSNATAALQAAGGASASQQQQEIAAANAIRAALQANTAQSVPIPQAPIAPPTTAENQTATAATATLPPPPGTVNPQIPALQNNGADAELPAPTGATEPSSADIDAAREQAFNHLTLTALPMTPQQIQRLRDLFADSQRAATVSPGGASPKPVASTQLVALDPGSTPPIIRLAQGYVTSAVFLDSTGQPWPIQGFDVGNPGAFNIQWDHKSNILLIQSSALYTIGNLAVQLKGLNTPVMITLIPGQPIVDYRIDMRIQGFGPNALPGHYGVQLPQAADNQLINVLDAVAPSKSRPLTIPGSDSQAWLVGDTIYLRTRLTLLSPAWVASMSSADGMNAYQIPKTPSILVGNNDGKIFNLRIEGY